MVNSKLVYCFIVLVLNKNLILFLLAGPPGPPVITVFPRVFSLQLTWNYSVQDINNIQILDYRIKVIDGTTREQVFMYTARTKTSFEIEKLARNTTYVVEIQARNEVGYGETASITARTLLAGKMINLLNEYVTSTRSYEVPLDLEYTSSNLQYVQIPV